MSSAYHDIFMDLHRRYALGLLEDLTSGRFIKQDIADLKEFFDFVIDSSSMPLELFPFTPSLHPDVKHPDDHNHSYTPRCDSELYRSFSGTMHPFFSALAQLCCNGANSESMNNGWIAEGIVRDIIYRIQNPKGQQKGRAIFTFCKFDQTDDLTPLQVWFVKDRGALIQFRASDYDMLTIATTSSKSSDMEILSLRFSCQITIKLVLESKNSYFAIGVDYDKGSAFIKASFCFGASPWHGLAPWVGLGSSYDSKRFLQPDALRKLMVEDSATYSEDDPRRAVFDYFLRGEESDNILSMVAVLPTFVGDKLTIFGEKKDPCQIMHKILEKSS